MSRFEIVKNEFRKYPRERIRIPVRTDGMSATYDFYLTEDVAFHNSYGYRQELVFTDIKVKLAPDEVLLLFIRNSVGTKNNIMLANGTSVINSSYYGNSSNDGNIGLSLYYYGDKDRVFLKKGTRIAQGIIVKYQTVDN